MSASRTTSTLRALLATVLIVLSSFAGLAVFGLSANALDPSNAGAAPAPSTLTGDSVRAPTVASLRAVATTFSAGNPFLLSMVRTTPDAAFEQAAAAIYSVFHPDAKPSGLSPTSIGFGAFLGITGIAASSILIGALCLAVGPATVGIGCAIAIAALVICAVITFFLGSSDASALGVAADLEARTILNGMRNAFIQESASMANNIVALNLTQYAISYAVASAAELQVANQTFNAPLAIVQSFVANQLASVAFADEMQHIAASSVSEQAFQSFYASTGFYGSNCRQLRDSGSTNPPFVNFPQTCGASTQFNGNETPLMIYTQSGTTSTAPIGSCILTYLEQGSTWVNLNPTGTWNVSFYPVSLNGTQISAATPTLAVTNVNTPTGAVASLTIPSNGYYVCGSAGLKAGWSFGSSESIPIAANQGPTIQDIPSGLAFGLWNSAYFLTYFATSRWSLAGMAAPNPTADNINSEWTSVENNTPLWLFNLENNGATVGQTLFTFLHLLGIQCYSGCAHPIPTNCIIPLPNFALPPNIPPSQLATLNASQLLLIYYAELNQLGRTFNVTNALTVSTFCGAHVTWNPNLVVVQFGTFGIGFLFVPSSTKNSTGSGTQFFSTFGSWNQTGDIANLPSVAKENVKTNTTWEAPQANPTVTIVQWGYTKLANGTFIYNRGPLCAPAGNSSCKPTPTSLSIGFISGNSTKTNGSIYPSFRNVSAPSGYAEYLKICWQASNPLNILLGLNVTWTHPSTCVFNVTTIANVWGNLTCLAGLGTCNGPPPLLAFGGCYGSSFPIVGGLINSIYTAIASIPFLGALGCVVAWVVFLLVITFVVSLGLFATGTAIRAYRYGAGRER